MQRCLQDEVMGENHARRQLTCELAFRSEEQKRNIFKRIDRQRAGFIGWGTNRAKEGLNKQLEDFLDRIQGIGQPEDISGRMETALQTDKIAGAIRDIHLKVGLKFATETFKRYKSMIRDWDRKQNEQEAERLQTTFERKVIQHVNQILPSKIQGISRENDRIINKVLQTAADENWTIQRTAEEIRDSWQKANLHRAKRIARTEIIEASNHASVEGAKSTGERLRKEWLSTRDNRVRIAPFNHLAPDGQRAGLDGLFNVSGEQLRFPGDSLNASPGNSINCRCTVTFIPVQRL